MDTLLILGGIARSIVTVTAGTDTLLPGSGLVMGYAGDSAQRCNRQEVKVETDPRLLDHSTFLHSLIPALAMNLFMRKEPREPCQTTR